MILSIVVMAVSFTASTASAQIYVTVRPPIPVIVRPAPPSPVHVWIGKSGKKGVASMFMSVAIGQHLRAVVQFGFLVIGEGKVAVARDGSEAIEIAENEFMIMNPAQAGIFYMQTFLPSIGDRS